MIRSCDVWSFICCGCCNQLSGAFVSKTTLREGHLACCVGFIQPRGIARGIQRTSSAKLRNPKNIAISVRIHDFCKRQLFGRLTSWYEPLDTSSWGWTADAECFAVAKVAGPTQNATHCWIEVGRNESQLLPIGQRKSTEMQSRIDCACHRDIDAPESAACNIQPLSVSKSQIDGAFNRKANWTSLIERTIFIYVFLCFHFRKNHFRRWNEPHAISFGQCWLCRLLDSRDWQRTVSIWSIVCVDSVKGGEAASYGCKQANDFRIVHERSLFKKSNF